MNFRPTPPSFDETYEQRIMRKAKDLRALFIAGGLVVSPDPEMPFESLPEQRQDRWIKLAKAYVEIMG